jgi:hypothetical protein
MNAALAAPSDTAVPAHAPATTFPDVTAMLIPKMLFNPAVHPTVASAGPKNMNQVNIKRSASKIMTSASAMTALALVHAITSGGGSLLLVFCGMPSEDNKALLLVSSVLKVHIVIVAFKRPMSK